MLTEKEKAERRSFWIVVLVFVAVSGYVGWNWGQSSLLTNLNERGELACEQGYCILYLDGTLDIGSDFEISRTY